MVALGDSLPKSPSTAYEECKGGHDTRQSRHAVSCDSLGFLPERQQANPRGHGHRGNGSHALNPGCDIAAVFGREGGDTADDPHNDEPSPQNGVAFNFASFHRARKAQLQVSRDG